MDASDEDHFSEEGITNVVAFLETLRGVHARLLAEGFVIDNGRVVEKDAKRCMKCNNAPK